MGQENITLAGRLVKNFLFGNELQIFTPETDETRPWCERQVYARRLILSVI